MQARNIVSVSWGDHLAFGDGDGRLDSPDAISRRMECWWTELGASMLHWRLHRRHLQGRFYAARGCRHPGWVNVPSWNDLDIVPHLAKETGLQAWLYVSLFDEGWPLHPKAIRLRSYHNAMHGQHVSWQTEFSRNHPEYALVDRTGTQRQWGVLCLAYREVREHFRQRFLNFLAGRGFDGLFICLRSQSRPADFADLYGFNKPVRQDYQKQYGRDICVQDFDLQSWRDLRGSYLTLFLRELREDLQPLGLRLAVGAARGDVLGPPLGNMTLDWRTWVRQGLIDGLVINQNSSQCPSMWHPLWPMHRGYGYLQNYLDGFNLPPLRQHLEQIYAPALAGKETTLYVARQWSDRSPDEEIDLLQQSSVAGLVFSSFRYDNPDAIARNDWRV